MKKYLLALALCLTTSGAFAASADAESCLQYGKTVMANNPDMLEMLSQARIVPDSAIAARYNGSVGSQTISTEVSARLQDEQEILGTMLCLFDADRPLYFWFNGLE